MGYPNFEELEIEATAEIQNAAEQSETGIVLEELSNKPDELLKDVESIVTEAGIDLNMPDADDTSYDMYN